MAEILVEKLGVPALYLANKVGLTIIRQGEGANDGDLYDDDGNDKND